MAKILSSVLEKDSFENKDKIILNEIKKDIFNISKYENLKKIDFYLLCSEILLKYKI